MSRILVLKIRRPDLATWLFRPMRVLKEDIRKRAYELSRERGSDQGPGREDWHQAERDLTYTAESEITSGDREFRVKLALPEFEAKDVHLLALPRSVVVEGEIGQSAPIEPGKKLSLEFELPPSVDISDVEAYFDNGVLQIVASKMEPPEIQDTLVA